MHAPPPHTAGSGSSSSFTPPRSRFLKEFVVLLPLTQPGQTRRLCPCVHPSRMASQECCWSFLLPGETLSGSSRTSLGRRLGLEELPQPNSSIRNSCLAPPHPTVTPQGTNPSFLLENVTWLCFHPNPLKPRAAALRPLRTTRYEWKRIYPKGEVGRGFWKKGDTAAGQVKRRERSSSSHKPPKFLISMANTNSSPRLGFVIHEPRAWTQHWLS